MSDLDLATAVPSTFEPFLGATFTTALPDGRVADLVLIEVTGPASGADARPFQVVFRGGPRPPCEQGVAHFANRTAGDVDLFVVPAAPDVDTPCYVAVLA